MIIYILFGCIRHLPYIVSGCAESEYELVAFDKALLSAGIGDYNLVRVSSIISAECTFREIINIPKGSILYAAYAKKVVIGGQSGSAAVAIAIPVCPEENGVIFEASSDTENAESIAIDMCRDAMTSRKRVIKEMQSSSITLHSAGEKYTCGISAVVMW